MHYILVVPFPNYYPVPFIFLFLFSIFVDRKTIFIVRRGFRRLLLEQLHRSVAVVANQAEPITLASRLLNTTPVLLATAAALFFLALPLQRLHQHSPRYRLTSTRRSLVITPATIYHHSPCHLSTYFSTTQPKPKLVISNLSRMIGGGYKTLTHYLSRLLLIGR